MTGTPTRSRRAQHGFTLIEACVVIALAAIVVAAGAPSFDSMMMRRHLDGRASELATDLHLLRSQVVAENRTLRISFQDSSLGSCYVIHSGSAGRCACLTEGPAQCTGGATARKSVFMPASGPVRIRANVGSMVFDPVHGTSTPTGTLRVIDRSGRAIHHVVNVLGRVRSCSPASGVAGYPTC